MFFAGFDSGYKSPIHIFFIFHQLIQNNWSTQKAWKSSGNGVADDRITVAVKIISPILFILCMQPPWLRRQEGDLQPERKGDFLQCGQGRVARTVLELGKYAGWNVGNFLGIILLPHAQDFAHPTSRFPYTLYVENLKIYINPKVACNNTGRDYT